MDEFSELEFKYKADHIKLTDFISLINKLKYNKRLDISSWDYYFVNKNLDSFQRFRQSNTPELTKKVKTSDGNNWNRVEVDLPLDPERITEAIVTKYVELDGYKFNFKIYKTCFIFILDYCNYVLYITYDENMAELGRFVEVEINKDKVNYLNANYPTIGTQSGAEAFLKAQEKSLSEVGLSPQNRMKKSLYELFVKEK
jgi:adenylate cyclase class IV